MRSLYFGLLLSSTVLVNAFRDTSPLFFFSTSDIPVSSDQIASEASLNKAISQQLRKCPSDVYLIISQPGVNALDFQDPFSAPHLRQKLMKEDENIRSSLIVSEVVGGFSSANLSRNIQDTCGASLLDVDASTGSFQMPRDSKALVINLNFPPLPTTKFRAAKLIEHDSFLASILRLLPSPNYSVLYTTTPTPASADPSHSHSNIAPNTEHYQIDTSFQFPSHLELKRDFSNHQHRAADSPLVEKTNAPLFEKYQFFGPGIFMGLLVSILLLSILFVAIRGISSLEVSYAAFDKEMGPAGRKKHLQQQ